MSNPLGVLIKITNVVEILSKYQIPRKDYEDIAMSTTVEIPHLEVSLHESKRIKDWNMIYNQVKSALKNEISVIDKSKSLLSAELHLEGLVASITNEIINRIHKRYSERGYLELIRTDGFNEEFNYSGTFKTVSDDGIAEYLVVTADGSFVRHNKMPPYNDYEYKLKANLKFRAITLNFNISPSEVLRVYGSEILSELKWYDSEIQTLN